MIVFPILYLVPMKGTRTMKIQRWQAELVGLLLLLSLGLYALRWALFPGPQLHNEMWRFLVGDVAFLFLQVLLVTMLIDGVLVRREKDEMRQKLNMIIGAFFAEAGTELLGRIATTDRKLADVRDDLVPDMSWDDADYARAHEALASHEPDIDIGSCDLGELKAMLTRERSYFLGLLGNQSLLEHESFSDLLWAITHLAEELSVRRDLDSIPGPDKQHLDGDVKRAFALLTSEWLAYMRHLQLQYPYLFSLAVRTNPLDPDACPTVEQ